MERKGKIVTKKWRDLRRKGTHKHSETQLRYFDDHRCLSRTEEGKCMWTHGINMILKAYSWTSRSVANCIQIENNANI